MQQSRSTVPLLAAVARQGFEGLSRRWNVRRGAGERWSRSWPRELATTVWAALHGLSLLAIDGILEQQVAGAEAYVRRACRAVVGMVIVPR